MCGSFSCLQKICLGTQKPHLSPITLLPQDYERPDNSILFLDLGTKLENNLSYLRKCRLFSDGMNTAVSYIKVNDPFFLNRELKTSSTSSLSWLVSLNCPMKKLKNGSAIKLMISVTKRLSKPKNSSPKPYLLIHKELFLKKI